MSMELDDKLKSFRSSAKSFWTNLATKEDEWEIVVGKRKSKKHGKISSCVLDCSTKTRTSILSTLKIAILSPFILVTTTIVLCILCSIGVYTIMQLSNGYETRQKTYAYDYAREMGELVSQKLDESILPLFTMSQFVQHLSEFEELPHLIGPLGEEGSLPFRQDKFETTHRNVTGVCDRKEVNDTFNQIAQNVKKDAGLEGILMNIQVAPFGVVCLAYPLYNTEDFDDGSFLDNRGAIGHDLLNDPQRSFIAKATILSYPNVVIAGPLTLIQEGTPKVKEAFIARLSIYMKDYNITFSDGGSYPSYGFVVALLNWENIKKQSGIDRISKETGLEYNLTRTDKIKVTNGDNGDSDADGVFTEKVVTIGHSDKSHILTSKNSVSVKLETTNNEWAMTVGYENGFRLRYFAPLIGIVVSFSLVLSLLLMVTLVFKKQHQILLYNIMPHHIIRKLERGETVVERYEGATIFFSDIVGFTTMSGNMSPLEVMEMLNDIYTEFDALVTKHKIHKIETIGDAYIAIGGGPGSRMDKSEILLPPAKKRELSQRKEEDHAEIINGSERIALFALDAIDFVRRYRTKQGGEVTIRCGLASGPVVAGVVGTSMPKFTLFGDTVNLASRMESTSKQMHIQCNHKTFCNLQSNLTTKMFDLEERIEGGKAGVFVKGKGQMQTWWVHGAKEYPVNDDITKDIE